MPHAVPSNDPLLLRFHPFELDERQARVTRSSQPVAMAPKAFGVLCALTRSPGQLVRKDDLLDTVWGHRHVSESVLKTTISELRTALGDDAKQPRFIETVSRHGYRFVAPLDAGNAPSTTRTVAGATSTLVGRQTACDRLHAAWLRAQAAQPQIVLVTGEAGMGKTTLIDHWVAGLKVRSAHGQCVEQHGAGEPYLPVLEALGGLCRNEPELPSLLRQVAPTWLLQLPWLSSDAEREALRRQLAGSGHERMPREFGEWIERWTATHPLLLVIEDLHWSDRATLRLIDHMARRRSSARVMCVASLRLAEVLAEEDHPANALRHELRLHRLAEEIALDPFSEVEVVEYLRMRSPEQAASEAFVRTLHARTDGLPLFVVNVVDEWLAPGTEGAAADDIASSDGPVPESLAGVLERQIARLEPEARTLLGAAAVCGAEFCVSTLADVLGLAADEIAQRCDRLAQRYAWLGPATVETRADGSIDARYAFRHALYRQVFRQRIGELQRVQLHRQIAGSLARALQRGQAVSAAELALHHELGHAWADALHCYALAASNALRHFAPHEAFRLTDHALSLLPRCPVELERDRLELELQAPRMTALQQVDLTAPEAHATYERVRLLTEKLPDHTSGLDIEVGWLHLTNGEPRRALAIAQPVHAGSRANSHRVRHVAACNLLGSTLLHLGRLEEARQRLLEGLSACNGVAEWPADTLAAVDLEVSLRCRLGQALAHLGHVDAAANQTEAALRRAERLGPYALRLAWLSHGLLQIRLERVDAVHQAAEMLRKIASNHSMQQALGPALYLRGWARARAGDPVAGHADLLAGVAVDEQLGMRRGRTGVLLYAADGLQCAGRWADAQDQIDAAFSLAERTGERMYLPDLWLLRARAALGQGEQARALSALNECLREAREQGALWVKVAAGVLNCECDPGDSRLRALADVRARLSEGAGSELLARADALLQRHSAGPVGSG